MSIKKLASETVIYGLSSIGGRLLNYALVPLHTAVLVTAGYGLLSELYAYAAFLTVLFLFRLETAFFRFGTEKKEREVSFTNALVSVSTLSILFSGLLMLMAQPIANYLEHPDQAIYVIFFAGIIGLDAISEVPFARLRLERKPIKFASIRIANICTNVLLNFFFLWFCPLIIESGSGILYDLINSFYHPDNNIIYIISANLTASSVQFLLLFPYFMKNKWQVDLVVWKKMVGYAAPLVVVGFAGIANEVLDRILLKKYLPYESLVEREAQLGIYAACYKLAMLISLFTQAFRYAVEPFFFSQAKNKNAPEMYAAIAKYFTIAGTIGFLGILLYLDIARYFIDENYWEGLKIVPILLMANIFLGLYFTLSVWYKLTDKTIMAMYISLGGALLTLILNFWWIPIPGIEYMGSAWATLITYFCMTAVSYFLGQKYFPVNYPIKRIFFYIILCVSIYLFSIFIHNTIQISFIIKMFINTILLIIYFGIIYLLERKTFLKVRA